MNYTLVIGVNSFLGKSFISKYKNKLKILGISISKKKIENFKLGKNLKFSFKNLLKEISDKKIDSLIYFHSYGTSQNQNSKKKIFYSNYTLAKKFYELAKSLNAKFIYFGSVSENDKSAGNYYAISKRKMINFMRKDNKPKKIKVLVLKLFYIYGINENKGRLFSLIRSSIKKNKIFYLNNPDQKIDFLHVSDFSRALFKVVSAKTKKKFSLYKLCYGYKYKLAEIFKNFENVKIRKKNSQLKKINYNILGYNRFNIEYNWKPQIKFLKGINDFFKNI
jgi:nucleoside-diphosphate-sugar epimerase